MTKQTLHLENRLPRAFFARATEEVAKGLIGKLLCSRLGDSGATPELVVARIVETEAYLAAGDSASHTFRGRNRKNEIMFGKPGLAYVYTIHARQCVNAVTEEEGVGCAVLIRAGEPVAGMKAMAARRGRDMPLDLARGPARLCQAMAIGREQNGTDLVSSDQLWVCDAPSAGTRIYRSSRIGVTSANEFQLRFYDFSSRFVSGPRKLSRDGEPI